MPDWSCPQMPENYLCNLPSLREQWRKPTRICSLGKQSMAPHSNAERMRNPSFRHTNTDNGFSLVELTIIISIVGILSSITLVTLSRSWASQRLLASTRELENWLGEQRRYAMRQNLTCKVIIDHDNKRLISTLIQATLQHPALTSPPSSWCWHL